jgi:hypothetical protein
VLIASLPQRLHIREHLDARVPVTRALRALGARGDHEGELQFGCRVDERRVESLPREAVADQADPVQRGSRDC